MRVEIWTDIICPWCGIGNHQLTTALERFGHAQDVELLHRSFQLDERAPMGETQSVRHMLRTKKGLSDAQIDGITAHVEKLAAAQGLHPYVVRENRVGNTSLAHELAAWATEFGRGKEIWDALYKAYFGEARSIFDVDSLVAVAGEHDLDVTQAREVLTSRRYAAQVLTDGRQAREIGVNGVPFVLIDGRYAVSGAQPVDALVQALELAWKNRPPPTEEPFPADTVCGPDGCPVPAGT